MFCDIEARSFNLDPAAVRDLLKRRCERGAGALINRSSGARVRALMPVHRYGPCAVMAALLDLAREFDLKVIEDAAQAIGADYLDGRRAGSMGDIGCLIKCLDEWTAGRQRNAGYYASAFTRAGLDARLQVPAALPGCRRDSGTADLSRTAARGTAVRGQSDRRVLLLSERGR